MPDTHLQEQTLAEQRSDASAERAPVCGTCAACGCPLGYGASSRGSTWYCCGGCIDSGRCSCGCDADHVRSRIAADVFVPTRRMFASRRPDELLGTSGPRAHHRAFPFADRRRGR